MSSLTRWLLIGLLLGVTLFALAGLLRPPLGLRASYWPSTPPTGAPERSTDFAWLTDATRIEPRLDLRGDEFGVYFFNDAARFNLGPDVQPGRDQLPFSVRWDGWLMVPSDGPRRFVLEANGPAHAWLDDVELAGTDATLQVGAGLHPIRVEYARPEAQVPSLRLQWQPEPGGALEPVGGEDVRWRPDGSSSAVSNGLSGLGGVLVAAVLVAGLGLGLWRLARRGAVSTGWYASLASVPLLFAAYGAVVEAPVAGRASILSGLDDWLIYESSARDILLHGPLMNGGHAHAPPFYGQPLYPYVLAVVHRLTGESLFGPIVAQFAALGLVVVCTALLAQRAFGRRLDGLAAAAAFLVVLQVEPEHFKSARQLFNENLYMPLVMASLIVLVGLARRTRPPPGWQALLAGGLLGLTAISRSQFLLCVPFGLLVVWLAWRRDAWRASAATALMAAGVLLAIAPVTARNWVVSGELVPISSSGGASLLEFHRPPSGLLDTAALASDPLYNALHLDQSTRTVVAFARADPLGYAGTLLPLAKHSLGLRGRNDPGIYWPLLACVLVYAASFGLRRTRRLHVWPIHAFVASHLLVLMLFEADTYGYRLVMPMYAPMVAVAAQVPLAAVQAALRSRAGAGMRSGDAARAARFAFAGWGVLAIAALVWQAAGLVGAWPQRETTLYGLGGAAAHAALTSEQVGAGAIYVASVDGTPRRFGAGALPGLRYPWFKWFDPTRSLPLAGGTTPTVYMLSELIGHAPAGDLTGCLGPPDASGEVVIAAEQARRQCAASLEAEAPADVTFVGVARIDAAQAPPSGVAGEALETRLVWQPLEAHPRPQQVSLQLDDPATGDGMQWGNGTLETYPAAEWQPDELLVSRIALATDPTALPQAYRLTLGIGPVDASNGPPAMATWQGAPTDRVPISQVTLTPGSAPVEAALPADMQPLEGPPLAGGGLQLIAWRPPPSGVAIGSPLRLGLLWRAMQDRPSAAQLRLRLVSAGGEVVQESTLPLLGGRVSPTMLRAGNVVRDEESVIIDSRAPSEVVSIEASLEDASGADAPPQRLGSLQLSGRAHVFDAGDAAPIASFGDGMQLLGAQLEPTVGNAGDRVTLKLRWRGAAAMPQAYKVFVHVLDPAGQSVVAQHDAEPQDGKAPTTGWVSGEVIDDAYTVVLPATLAPGQYPLELGVYSPSSGARLTLADGSNRLVLANPLTIR